ncbi:hypothetical protein EDC96DRAFT_543511 [Choanephora cucurbitarum]|nr:hypothetical protein EDC96DRAFT_543511 [Choanephora cucurbitarum]
MIMTDHMGSFPVAIETVAAVKATTKLSENFGLLYVEVKRPSCVATQSSNDCLQIALNMKRSVKNQDLDGIQSPRCFCLLLDGLVVISFAVELNSCEIYTFFELEEFSLLLEKAELGILLDIFLS